MTHEEESRDHASLLREFAKNSYLLSRAIHWWGRIETVPRLRIPVPRAFTHRDP